MSQPDYFLKAKECGRLAHEATDPRVKEIFLKEQAHWLALADAMVRHDAGMPAGPKLET